MQDSSESEGAHCKGAPKTADERNGESHGSAWPPRNHHAGVGDHQTGWDRVHFAKACRRQVCERSDIRGGVYGKKVETFQNKLHSIANRINKGSITTIDAAREGLKALLSNDSD